MVQQFRDLRVYRRSVELRQGVFTLSQKWPATERFDLTSQARRASRAVSAAIAEAWAKRRYERHFIAKLTDALAEAEETSVWLDVGRECGYLDDVEHAELRETCNAIAGGLVSMMAQASRWCGPASLVSDCLVEYEFIS